MRCSWIIFKKSNGRYGCLPELSRLGYKTAGKVVKSIFGDEKEAIAYCKALEERDYECSCEL